MSRSVSGHRTQNLTLIEVYFYLWHVNVEPVILRPCLDLASDRLRDTEHLAGSSTVCVAFP